MVTKPSQRARKQGKRKLRIYVDSNGNQRRTLTTYYKFHKRFPDFYYFHGAYIQKEQTEKGGGEGEVGGGIETFGEREYVFHVKLIYHRQKGHDDLIAEVVVHWFGNVPPLKEQIERFALNYYDATASEDGVYVSSNDINEIRGAELGSADIYERSGYSYAERIEYNHNL